MHRVHLTSQRLAAGYHAISSSSSVICNYTDSLYVPRTRLLFGEWAFLVAAPKMWNQLPDDFRCTSNTNTFKKKNWKLVCLQCFTICDPICLYIFAHVNMFVSYLYSAGQLSAVAHLTVCNCNCNHLGWNHEHTQCMVRENFVADRTDGEESHFQRETLWWYWRRSRVHLTQIHSDVSRCPAWTRWNQSRPQYISQPAIQRRLHVPTIRFQAPCLPFGDVGVQSVALLGGPPDSSGD